MIKFTHHIGIKTFIFVTLIYFGVNFLLHYLFNESLLYLHLRNILLYLFLIISFETIIVIKNNFLIDKVYFFIKSAEIDIMKIKKIQYPHKNGLMNKLMKNYLYISYNKYDDYNLHIKNKEELIKELLKINPNIEVIR